ncbi:unnamed protein product, partial [Amoebophrya sp. A25]|eukprot:GSA25T00000657001.1
MKSSLLRLPGSNPNPLCCRMNQRVKKMLPTAFLLVSSLLGAVMAARMGLPEPQNAFLLPGGRGRTALQQPLLSSRYGEDSKADEHPNTRDGTPRLHRWKTGAARYMAPNSRRGASRERRSLEEG